VSRVSALALAPQDAVKAFTDVIALLLAVGFEAADTAADPETSRALIALVNFGAGQGICRSGAGHRRRRPVPGHFDAVERRDLRRLEAAQERAFRSLPNLPIPVT